MAVLKEKTQKSKTNKKNATGVTGTQGKSIHYVPWLLPQSPSGRRDQPQLQALQDPGTPFTHGDIPPAVAREGGDDGEGGQGSDNSGHKMSMG